MATINPSHVVRRPICSDGMVHGSSGCRIDIAAQDLDRPRKPVRAACSQTGYLVFLAGARILTSHHMAQWPPPCLFGRACILFLVSYLHPRGSISPEPPRMEFLDFWPRLATITSTRRHVTHTHTDAGG